MFSLLFKFLVTTCLAAVLLCSCSSNMEDKNEEQTESYQTQSAEIGHEAAEMIKVPMGNAQDAVDIENERMREYEKQLND